MSKERFLTVLVPVTDSDCEATVYADVATLIVAVPPSVNNINKIYKIKDGTYQRVWFNPSSGTSGQYEYHTVIDREFPYLGIPLEIFDFTYSATRMGTAPTISAQGVMRFAEKDGQGKDVTLEGMWTQECHVSFNGENFYLKQIPTSSKSNEDERYRYDIEFASESVILEQVYIYDVVSPFITEKPASESYEFSFYGDINELAKRINASLIRSGLATIPRKYVYYPTGVPDKPVPYLDYKQWTSLLVNPLPLIGVVFEDSAEMINFRIQVYLPLGGDYNRYLMEYIYQNTDGIYDLVGYQCKIGNDKKGNPTSSEEKLISFDKNTIHEALQEFHETFELQYYIDKEKDEYGNFTGNTVIWVADCEHDFADRDYILLTSRPSDWSTNYSNYYKIVDGEYVSLTEEEPFALDTYYKYDFVRDDEGTPTTESPFDYGVYEALLSKEKANTTDKIVTRITGVGGSENITWYYPNPSPDGWIKPIFKRKGQPVTGVTIDYPINEGDTVAESVRYEKFLKNRIGNTIRSGFVFLSLFSTDYFAISDGLTPSPIYYFIKARYKIDTTGKTQPRLTLEHDYSSDSSHCTSISAELLRGSTVVGTYDSSTTYAEPDNFQQMMINSDGGDMVVLIKDSVYYFDVEYHIPSPLVPLSEEYTYSGHYYPSLIMYAGESDHWACIGEDFYEESDLQPYIRWAVLGGNIHIYSAGYSTNGEESGRVSPIPRKSGKQYKDLDSGSIYLCTDDQPCGLFDTTHRYAYDDDPKMKPEEWISKFVNMNLRLYSNDGWYEGGKMVSIEDYGLGKPMLNGSEIKPDIFDAIEFKRQKYITPQKNLMPEVYIRTDGERRFYNAHNYWDAENETLYDGTADSAIGEVQVGSKVKNPIYKENESDSNDKHYRFENEYVQDFPHEHIENFEDVNPTITEQKNYINVTDVIDETIFNANKEFFYVSDGSGGYTQCTPSSIYDNSKAYFALLRIDVMDDFAYDETDNDEIWEINEDGSVKGEYKHPYFFARLRPLGFNIFDLALQDDMVISMTTGDCGSCNFKIGVDEKTNKNPVQIWTHDVYGGPTWNSKGDKLYSSGDLRRYVNTTSLYYDTTGGQDGYLPVNMFDTSVSGGLFNTNTGTYDGYVYPVADVENGLVGSVKQEGRSHFEGDVVTIGKFIDIQQDTSENFVWVALMKDTDSYGTIMPSAIQNYQDPQLNTYIRPKSVSDVHETDGEFVEDEENADKFVITNIRMPQIYLRRAERYLSRTLVAYMYDNNYQKFNFSIVFSRIFIAQNKETDEKINENSVLYVLFNGKTYRQYVNHYSYKMSHEDPLPEISVDMKDELSVSRTVVQRLISQRKKDNNAIVSQTTAIAQQMVDKSARKTSSQIGNAVVQATTTIREDTTKKLEWGEF